MQNYFLKILQVVLTCFVFLFITSSSFAEENPKVKIGVLAKRGEGHAIQKWSATAKYLSDTIAGYEFVIVPLDFQAVHESVKNSEIDFLITNSGSYVSLEAEFGISRIATMINMLGGSPQNNFGGVIFTLHSNAKINSIKDLKGKTFMAVDEKSFGGWEMAWHEMFKAKIDPQKDLHLSFGGTHDNVVNAVLSAKVDAGTVRTDTLERMSQEGLIDLKRIKVINLIAPNHFVYMRSTPLYPEWPFATLKHTSNHLSKDVSLALFRMSSDSEPAIKAKIAGWTVPLEYHLIHELKRDLHLYPYNHNFTFQQFLNKYYLILIFGVITLCVLILFTFFVLILNRKLTTTKNQLKSALRRSSREERKIKQLNRFLQSVIDALPEPLLVINLNYELVYKNQAALKQGGELTYKCCHQLMRKYDEPCSSRGIQCPIDTIKETGKLYIGEQIFYNQDGTTRLCEVRAYPIFNEEGELIQFIEYIVDVTSRKKAEQERFKLESQLRQAQKMEAIGTFAGGIAHDFNNILAAILGFTDLSMQPGIEADELQENLKKVIVGGKRASDLVRQILLFSRQGKEEKKVIFLDTVIAESMPFIRALLPKTIQIEEKIPHNVGPILADSGQLMQVLLNLASNAQHAMDTNGGEFSIKIQQREESVTLTISDTGVGMPPEVLENIFNPFFTTKEVGQGTGMGLSQCYGIVHAHGGEIKVHSIVDKGTTFEISFPISYKPHQELLNLLEPILGGDETILVVDDEEDLVEMWSKILIRLGYSVCCHTSSADALTAFSQNPDRFDVVLTDYAMPEINGVNLSKEMLKINPDIPIILLTGYSERISSEESKKIGIKGFCYKPVPRQEIAKLIREVLNK